jgi:hypothetical protein
MMPATSATMPAANHTITQIWRSGMPTDSAALWLVGDRAQRPPDARLREEDARATAPSPGHGGCDVECWTVTNPPTKLVRASRQVELEVIITFGSPPKMNSPTPDQE